MRRAAALVLLLAVAVATGGATWLQFQSDPADGSPGMTVTGLLRLPEGEGPFPAAILLPDCDGISPHEREWGVRFQQAGYVAYLIDSLFTRNLESGCGRDLPLMDDLRGAVARLEASDAVDADRIVVVGWGEGGDTALAWAATEGAGAVVAFYPACAGIMPLRRPTLFVLPSDYAGEAACNAWAQEAHEAGVTAVQRIAPWGVGAGFDCAECADGFLGGPGGWNAPAAELVEKELFAEIGKLLEPR